MSTRNRDYLVKEVAFPKLYSSYLFREHHRYLKVAPFTIFFDEEIREHMDGGSPGISFRDDQDAVVLPDTVASYVVGCMREKTRPETFRRFVFFHVYACTQSGEYGESACCLIDLVGGHVIYMDPRDIETPRHANSNEGMNKLLIMQKRNDDLRLYFKSVFDRAEFTGFIFSDLSIPMVECSVMLAESRMHAVRERIPLGEFFTPLMYYLMDAILRHHHLFGEMKLNADSIRLFIKYFVCQNPPAGGDGKRYILDFLVNESTDPITEKEVRLEEEMRSGKIDDQVVYNRLLEMVKEDFEHHCINSKEPWIRFTTYVHNVAVVYRNWMCSKLFAPMLHQCFSAEGDRKAPNYGWIENEVKDNWYGFLQDSAQILLMSPMYWDMDSDSRPHLSEANRAVLAELTWDLKLETGWRIGRLVYSNFKTDKLRVSLEQAAAAEREHAMGESERTRDKSKKTRKTVVVVVDEADQEVDPVYVSPEEFSEYLNSMTKVEHDACLKLTTVCFNYLKGTSHISGIDKNKPVFLYNKVFKALSHFGIQDDIDIKRTREGSQNLLKLVLTFAFLATPREERTEIKNLILQG